MSQVSVGLAFIAGILSFLSPCVLPLVPGYISLISGLSFEELTRQSDRKTILKKTGLGSLFFVLGFTLVFTLMGASASLIGGFLREHMDVMARIAGVIIILFGLHMTGILPIRLLYYEKRFHTQNISPGLIGPFLMGIAFAFGWTPCIGPILATILALAAAQETIVQGVFLLIVYSLGLGIPFILTGLGVNAFLQFFSRYKRFIRWGEVTGGILLIGVGTMIFFNKLTALVSYMPDFLIKFAL